MISTQLRLEALYRYRLGAAAPDLGATLDPSSGLAASAGLRWAVARGQAIGASLVFERETISWSSPLGRQTVTITAPGLELRYLISW